MIFQVSTFITPTWETGSHVWIDLDLILKQADLNQERVTEGNDQKKGRHTLYGQQTPLDGAPFIQEALPITLFNSLHISILTNT